MSKATLAELLGVPSAPAPKFRANLNTAVELCRTVEAGAPKYGCHVALTGGCLYKDGDRKDFDLMFYRIRQVESIDQDGLFQYLERLGFSKPKGFGWIFKSEYKGVQVDILFPEEQGGEYVSE